MKKVDLSRFKKTMAGLIEFAVLIEQASTPQRKRLLQTFEQADALFLRKAMRKVVYFEELEYLDESILAEILDASSPTILAYALRGMPKEFRDHMVGHLPYRKQAEFRDEEDKIKTKSSTSFVEGAQRQILKIGRELEKKNRFVFELMECPRFDAARKRKAAG